MTIISLVGLVCLMLVARCGQDCTDIESNSFKYFIREGVLQVVPHLWVCFDAHGVPST